LAISGKGFSMGWMPTTHQRNSNRDSHQLASSFPDVPTVHDASTLVHYLTDTKPMLYITNVRVDTAQ